MVIKGSQSMQPNINRKLEKPRIYARESLREILLADFKMALPISGGWGYEIQDAVVINKQSSNGVGEMPQNRLSIQNFIIQKRAFEELIIFRKTGDKFGEINWLPISQRLLSFAERKYDHLRFSITCLHDSDIVRLKNEYFDQHDKEGAISDWKEFVASHAELHYYYETDYWFDISVFD